MRLRRMAAAVLCCSTALALEGLTGFAAAEDSVIATFEGGTLRLADGWGEAGACHSDDVGTRCYRTELEMDRAEGLSQTKSAAPMAVCSTSVRLYRSTNYGGGVLSLTQRGTGIALGPYGFDNDTSSYKIGACSAIFYDGGVGSAVYPGWTGAGASATSMVAGWNNRVSTVYIN